MLFSPLLHACTSISESNMMLWQALCAITVVFILESSGSIKDVQWPAGTYGIPKPVSGCPKDDGFRWQTGWRLQQMSLYYADHSKSNNSRSPEFHLDGKVTKSKVNRSFCIKRKTSDDLMWHRPTWPRGKYCIYKKSEYGDCPEGLTSGWVFWTDHNIYGSDDDDGTLPDGDYERSTEIHFCCRTDGNINDPISLPYKTPFYLLAYKSAKCQMVKWAVASLEWIYYDTEGDVERDDNWDDRNGSYPYNAGKMHPTIYYCYYQGCKKTLSAISGTIQSPNYPKNYPNGQYCSWKIMVNITQQIHLVFRTFKLQQERFTDELHVYDGEDDRGEILGVFYGGNPPPKEGIFSSASRMYLVFKSDGAQSFNGFSASYHAGNYKRPGCNETLTTISGTFQTPNYPRNYPDGEYCSWRIMVNTSQHIHLVFTSFSLQNDQNTDVVYVYDGENATGMVLGEFYGRNLPPKEGICISSNSIFVLFKSDNVGSYPGFKAAYHGVDRSELCVMTSTTAQTVSVQTSQTPPVNSTAGIPKEGGKKDESKQPKKKGFNLVVVVVPVVSVALIAALLVAGICYCKRKKWKRLPGQDDAIFLRLNEESTATVENSEI